MPHSRERAAGRIDGPTILVVSDHRDWHLSHRLARGSNVSILASADSTREARADSRYPSWDRYYPTPCSCARLSAGSFEAITKRLGVLHALSSLGVVVWNHARAIERCVDKSMTSFLLARAGVPTPPTWTTESAVAARALVEREAPRGPLCSSRYLARGARACA